MGVLQHVHVAPIPLAAVLAIVASFANGFATVEIRGAKRVRAATCALMAADVALLLCIPQLPPVMVTCISGISMSVVVWLSRDDTPKVVDKVAACIVALSVVLVAIDHALAGEPTPKELNPTHQALFWAAVVLMPSLAGALTLFAQYRMAQYYIMFACGIQSVINVTLVYVLMAPPSRPAIIPVLAVNSLFGIYLTKTSLSVNKIHVHMPVVFAIYSAGIWASTPAVQAVDIHSSALSTFATVLCIIASAVVLFDCF